MAEPPDTAPVARGRIWLINQWMPPDLSPTAVLAGEVAGHLETQGWTVIRVSRARVGDDGIDDRRSRVLDRIAPSTGLLAKVLSWPRFVWRCRTLLRRELVAGDVVIVASDPPLAYVPISRAARLAGARVVHWSQDVYPEVLAAYQPGLRMPLAPLRWLRDRALRRMDRVVAISVRMAERLRRSGARVGVIANWTGIRPDAPIAVGESKLRRRHFAADDFVVAYSGNLGRVHEFDTLVRAAARLAKERAIRFLIVGGGPRLAELRAQVQALALSSFEFLPLRPAAELADSLAAADVHFVSLRASFDGLVLPSKIYGIAASARPILYCGDASGETATLIAHFDCGLSVAQGDDQALAAAILRLRADSQLRTRMGQGALSLLGAAGDRDAALDAWSALASELGAPPSSPAV